MHLLVYALSAVLLTASAQAQPLAAVAPRDPTLQLTPPDPELFQAQRRQRMWMAAGIGMVTSSLAHLAVLGARQNACNDRSHASLGAAAVFGGVGFMFALGGSMRLAHTLPRYPATRGQKAGAVFLALGTALTVQALLMPLWLVQGVACSS